MRAPQTETCQTNLSWKEWDRSLFDRLIFETCAAQVRLSLSGTPRPNWNCRAQWIGVGPYCRWFINRTSPCGPYGPHSTGDPILRQWPVADLQPCSRRLTVISGSASQRHQQNWKPAFFKERGLGLELQYLFQSFVTPSSNQIEIVSLMAGEADFELVPRLIGRRGASSAIHWGLRPDQGAIQLVFGCWTSAC